MARSRTSQLARIISRTERLLAKGTSASARVTRWRLVLFLVGLVCAITFYKLGWYQSGNITVAGFVAVFVTVAAYHNRLESRIHRLRLWKGIKAAHLARIRLDWSAIPPRSGESPAFHLYAQDLDLIGPHSLTHLLDTTVSDQGGERLRLWVLVQPPPASVWATRQALVQELAPRALFRDRLVLEARLAGEQEINGRRLAAVVEHAAGFPRLMLVLAIQSFLAVTTLVLGAGALLNWLPGYWMFSFGLYALMYLMTDQGEELLEHAVGLHHEMERLSTVLRHIERHARPAGSALARACLPLLEPGLTPSSVTRHLARILSAISIKAHPLVHLAFDAIGPWDLFFTLRLQQMQRRIRTRLPAWLHCLAEVEAASALATFAHLHPTYVWPTESPSPQEGNGVYAAVSARQLGHPLIPEQKRIANDYALKGLGSITLITGSNMSGKSAFLRTIGINLCLAQAGAPVCASRFEWTWSRLACCIRVDDSLEAGLSFFMRKSNASRPSSMPRMIGKRRRCSFLLMRSLRAPTIANV